MVSLRERISYHEAAHAIACLSFGIPIIFVTVATDTPHLLRGHYRPPPGIGLEAMCILALAGPAGEEFFCGPINEDAGRVDHQMAREYLAHAGFDPLRIGVEFNRYRDAAERLVRSEWGQDRIRRIAAALLKRGTLTGEEICGLTGGEVAGGDAI
jgi:hypothetical protein